MAGRRPSIVKWRLPRKAWGAEKRAAVRLRVQVTLYCAVFSIFVWLFIRFFWWAEFCEFSVLTGCLIMFGGFLCVLWSPGVMFEGFLIACCVLEHVTKLYKFIDDEYDHKNTTVLYCRYYYKFNLPLWSGWITSPALWSRSKQQLRDYALCLK
jgi:hypothetical protein